MEPDHLPVQETRRKLFLLRGLLIVAVGGLLVDAGVVASGPWPVALLVVFFLSDLLLLRIPAHWIASKSFELSLGAGDIVLAGLGIHLAGAAAGALPVSCLLMILVAALSSQRSHAVTGAAGVVALHAWVFFEAMAVPGPAHQFALQILFVCSVGLYYAFLTEGIHHLRREEHLEQVDRRELTTLLEILDRVTSSLDLQEVTKGVVQRLHSVVPSVRCSILYIDETRTRAYVLASHEDPKVHMLEIDLLKYPEIRRAIETRSTVIIRDMKLDPLLEEVREFIRDLGFQSIIVIPLTFGPDILGTLCLRTARAGRAFTEREIRFCTAVARASANALKNALLHRRVVEESARQRGTSTKLARILTHSPDLILTTDNDGLINEFNRAAERLLGFERAEVLGEPSGKLLGEGMDPNLVGRVRSARVLSEPSCRLRKKDGCELDIELHTAVLEDDEGTVTGTVWLGRDISELKSAQLQLLQAEKLSTIGEVISGIAHELNNPLSGVVGYSQLVMSRHGDSPLVRELERINDSALRCQRIVRNLLSFARVHKPERKYLGINGIIAKTLDLKEYQLRVTNVEVVRELDPDLPPTMLDFHQIQQVLLNLTNNAQHAISASRDRSGRLVVRSSHTGGIIRVDVIDNGEGMDRETLSRVFDPFYTTKPSGEGTGLGLSVSYGIVKEHGGRIFATSRKGHGSTFTVELPILRGEASNEPEDEGGVTTQRAAASRKAQVLVVDDEPTIQDLLIDILEESGHRVDTASNGEEAVRKVGAKRYDLVISDVRMPRMNGIELYRNLLSLRPEIEGKVVFITGDLINRDVVRFLAQTRARTLAKPLEISRVIDVVNELVGEPQGSSLAVREARGAGQ